METVLPYTCTCMQMQRAEMKNGKSCALVLGIQAQGSKGAEQRGLAAAHEHPSRSLVPTHTVMSSEDITQDGLVRKTVLTEGSGEPPPLHARCLGDSRIEIALCVPPHPLLATHI